MSLRTRASLLLRLHDRADDAAWQEFVSLYEPIVFATARRRGMQEADAAEVTQEVLLRVSAAIERFDPAQDGSFRGWLARITRNQTIDFFRRGELRGAGSTEMLRKLESLAAPTAGADFDLEHRRGLLRKAAAELRVHVAARQWDAFWLSAVQGVPSAEVARRLRMEIGAVYVARCRMLARLRKLVQRWEAEMSDAGFGGEI